MKRLWKSLSCALIFLMFFSSAVSADAPIDIRRHWAGRDIHALMSKSLMTAYPDGRFKPDRYISKEEVARIIARTIAEGGGEEGAEDDVAFGSPENVSREEAASMIFKMISKLESLKPGAANALQSDAALSAVPYPSDISMSPYCDEIEALYKRGVLNGMPKGKFQPQNPITRSEFAVMLRRAMSYEPLSPEHELPSSHTIAVPYLSQLWPVSAPVGCEGASLLMGLKAKGYAENVDLKQFLDAMPKTESDPAKGFVGSPYVPDLKKRMRTTIFPPKLTEFGSRYGKVLDFSGADLNQIQSEVLAGNPVVVYMTMNYEKPFYRFYDVEGEQKYFLSNNHVVLLAGYDAFENKYFIVDPYNEAKPKEPYSYWLPGELFEKIYKERHHALVIE